LLTNLDAHKPYGGDVVLLLHFESHFAYATLTCELSNFKKVAPGNCFLMHSEVQTRFCY